MNTKLHIVLYTSDMKKLIHFSLQLGLRTLTVARRDFSDMEYSKVHEDLMSAKKSLDNREEQVSL